MRREFIQVIAVFSFALGAGLFAFGRHLDPPLDATNPIAVQQAMNRDKETHIGASMASGAGVCLMTFGGLSLAIPWVNEALARRHQRTDAQTV